MNYAGVYGKQGKRDQSIAMYLKAEVLKRGTDPDDFFDRFFEGDKQPYSPESVPTASKEKCMQESTNLKVEVERGMGDGDKVTFPHMGQQTPGQLPGKE